MVTEPERPFAVDQLRIWLADDSCGRMWSMADSLRAGGAMVWVASDVVRLTAAFAAPAPDVIVLEVEAGDRARAHAAQKRGNGRRSQVRYATAASRHGSLAYATRAVCIAKEPR